MGSEVKSDTELLLSSDGTSTNPWIVQSSPFRFSYVQNPAKSISSMELDALEQHSTLKSALRAENSRFLVASSLSFHASAARRLACA